MLNPNFGEKTKPQILVLNNHSNRNHLCRREPPTWVTHHLTRANVLELPPVCAREGGLKQPTHEPPTVSHTDQTSRGENSDDDATTSLPKPRFHELWRLLWPVAELGEVAIYSSDLAIVKSARRR